MTKSMTSRPATMGDIAKDVGVSRTTVSFVLNKRPSANISDATRTQVMDAARRLGYRVNARAQALATQRSGTYGVLTEVVTAPFAVDIIKGAQDEAWNNGRLLLIASTDSQPDVERKALDTMLEQRVEGLIVAATWHRPVEVPEAAGEVPTVMVNCFDTEGRFPSVVPDEETGGYDATRVLIDAGHRRIGFVNLDPGIPAGIGRRTGYERALGEAGIDVDPSLVVAGGATADTGYLAAAELLARDETNRPTALFCGNDRIAMGVYDAAREQGLRIPEDLAVVGFDDQTLLSEYLRPALTTVALPFAEMGQAGMRMLEGGVSPRTHRQLHCPVIHRRSV